MTNDAKPSTEFIAALSAAAERLVAVDDPLLRNQLRAVAKAFMDATDGPAVVSAVVTVDHTVESPALAESVAPAITDDADVSRRTRYTPPVTDADLPQIEAHCRLKADATRWAIHRQQMLSKGAKFSEEVRPKDEELIAKAKSPQGCFLWMSASPIDESKAGFWVDVAGCFEATAEAVALVHLALADHSRQIETPLKLLAEAQSALRCAVGLVDGPTDPDQVALHKWLVGIASEQQILIKRFMRADDAADPETLPDIGARIESAHLQLKASIQQRKTEEARFSTIRYHLKQIAAGPADDHDWQKVSSTIDEMVHDGLPPSNVKLRGLLLPFLDQLPELVERPVGFSRVLNEINRYLDSSQEEGQDEQQQPKVETAEVREARRLLSGRSALFVGGLVNQHAKRSLEQAFGLKELIWFETVEHKSLDIYKPFVIRPDVVLVVLAIRWSSHAYGGLREMCKKYGKHFVSSARWLQPKSGRTSDRAANGRRRSTSRMTNRPPIVIGHFDYVSFGYEGETCSECQAECWPKPCPCKPSVRRWSPKVLSGLSLFSQLENHRPNSATKSRSCSRWAS